jgi:alkanesulfonate monooxygenase SsuD/methylene tetrahydromethanopterin reductase-like flavin-dependent oxidoreductase (luciferase family)
MPKPRFVTAGAVGNEIAAELAPVAEAAGYSTFWVNDTPGADSIAVLAHVARVTTRMRLGTGVIPIDRRSPSEIIGAVSRLDLPNDRLLIGIGSGARRTGSLSLVAEGVRALQEAGLRVAVGALGDRMVALGARDADAILLNWLTPEWAKQSAMRVQSLVTGTSAAEIVAYVRVGLPPSEQAVRQEAARYAGIPQYAAHFQRMGVDAFDTCIVGEPADIAYRLHQYHACLDETVIRAVASSESVEDYLDVLEAGRPSV